MEHESTPAFTVLGVTIAAIALGLAVGAVVTYGVGYVAYQVFSQGGASDGWEDFGNFVGAAAIGFLVGVVGYFAAAVTLVVRLTRLENYVWPIVAIAALPALPVVAILLGVAA